MRDLVQKILNSKYGRLVILFDMLLQLSMLLGAEYLIDTKQYILLSMIVVIFAVKCYYISYVIINDYNIRLIKAINNESLTWPQCHKETLEFHDYNEYGCEIVCTNCNYSKERQ